MQKLLTKKERQLLINYYASDETGYSHPLLLVCLSAFSLRAGKLEHSKAEAEDIFRSVAELLDLFIAKWDADSIVQKEVDEYWTWVLNDVRYWSESTISDRVLIADTIFRILRQLMCHHWKELFCECVFDYLNKTLERESKDADMEELNRFNECLREHSFMVDDWINNEYDGHLSEEIESIIQGKTENPKRKCGRRPIDPKTITESFNYLPRVADRGARLLAFCQSLKGKYIDINTDPKDFIDIFQNTTTTKKIVWLREIVLLKYLIIQLNKRKFITCPSGYTKWQIVCAHFQIMRKKKEVVDNITDDSYIIEDLQTTHFTKGGKLHPKNDDIDNIIRILDPLINYNDALNDYFDAQQEHDEIKDTKDALSNGLNTDLRL